MVATMAVLVKADEAAEAERRTPPGTVIGGPRPVDEGLSLDGRRRRLAGVARNDPPCLVLLAAGPAARYLLRPADDDRSLETAAVLLYRRRHRHGRGLARRQRRECRRRWLGGARSEEEKRNGDLRAHGRPSNALGRTSRQPRPSRRQTPPLGWANSGGAEEFLGTGAAPPASTRQEAWPQRRAGAVEARAKGCHRGGFANAAI